MVKIGYADITNFCDFDCYFQTFSTLRRNYIESIKDYNRRKQSVAVWVLLNKMLSMLNYKVEYDVDKNGKWFDKNGRLNFSISHSGNICAVVISDQSLVGIDVEKVSDKIYKIKKNATNINKDLPLKDALTIWWTEKESKFKCGVLGRFTTKKIFDREKNKYYITVCSEYSVNDFVRISIN